MIKIGLSGKIGTGKSTFASYLSSLGAYVVEVDDIMTSILRTDEALITQLQKKFGDQIFHEGTFSSKKSQQFFINNGAALREFHSITNSFIEKIVATKLREAKAKRALYFVLVSPEISQRNSWGLKVFDYLVHVRCSDKEQITRLKARSSTGRSEIEKLLTFIPINTQYAIDYEVVNDLDLNNLKVCAQSFHKKLINTKQSYLISCAKALLLSSIFSGTLAHAQAIYPSCVLNQTCTISTNQTSTIVVTASMTPLIIDLGVTISTSAGGYALINQAGNVITNNGSLNLGNGDGFQNNSPLALFQNNGVVKSFGPAGSIGFDNTSTITSLSNSNLIQGLSIGIKNEVGGTIVNLTNETLGSIGGGGSGINNLGSISNLVNSGTVSSAFSSGLYNQGPIEVLTNVGIFRGYSSFFGIDNTNGSITTLNNLQGTTSSAGVLKYTGVLPTNYNIIINSPTNFGQLNGTGGHSGTMNFGIYAGGIAGVPASSIRAGTYKSVLIGFQTPLALNNVTTGNYNSYTWNLVIDADAAAWDLVVTGGDPIGPSVANTNQSLVNTASALQGTYTLQNSVIANSFSYDCNVFGANNVCVSAGGRNTTVQAANGLNNTSALLIAAYRLNQNYRIGAYADQNLSVSNPGGTVNLGNNTPLIGLFGAWSQRLNGTGAEVKVSAAYGQKNTTITRSVVGSGDGASEAGSGSSKLNSQGAQVTAKYGFAVTDKTIVSPYVGVRYTQNNMGGYTEGTSSSVTAPLTYSALNTNATTALAGVGASYKVIPAVTTFASAGVETDTNTANGTYVATNTSIGTLTPVNFNANPVRTRPTATVGAYYDVAKNQRFGVTGIYRQEAYQAVSTTTVMATYTIGL